MATNELIRKKFQAGTEGTRGTSATVTRIMYADVNYSYDRPIQEFPDRSGTYFARRRIAYQRPNIGFSGTDLLTYEDLPLWLELGVAGGVSPSTIAGTPANAYKYVYTPHATNDNIKSWTVEFNESANVYKSTQFMLNSWTLRIDPDNEGAWMFDFEGFARDWNTTGAFTSAGITDRTTEAIRAGGTSVYIDDTTIGTTLATGKIIDFSLTCNLNLHMKAFMENAEDWAQGKVGRGPRTFDMTMTMEFDSDTEFAKYRSSTEVLRRIRVVRTGSQVNTVPTLKRAQVDIYGYWRSIGFGDREGNLTATMGLQGFYNATASTDVSIEVTNALATLP